MNYQEALDWLLARPQTDLEGGVARVQYLLDLLGNPEKEVPTVHFVGTNGKGSTLNALQFMLMEAGYRVGRFTSPSILDYREQIVCQQEMIPKEALAAIVTDLLPLIETSPGQAISEFEILVVVMFVYLARYQKVDILLVEAGMGGLLDATNVLQPLAVVCPSIGLDHQSFLGESHAAIARHKVAVLKEGVPFVYATDLAEVEAVFEGKAAELGSPSYALGRDFTVKEVADGFDFEGLGHHLKGLRLRMLGRHQQANAGLALMTLLLLREQFSAVDERAMREGLAQAHWPGRMELFGDSLMLDGAHNNESVAVLCQLLERQYSDREVNILFAAINTKPIDTMLASLSQRGRVTVTSFDDPRAVDLADYPAAYPRIESFESWLDQADLSNPKKLYLVTGSLYFITFVRKYIISKQ